ncbi:MAG: cytochrome c3 family protein [Candidatus Aminicenantes bacterium]|nr:cytochrome c3 family protein [Candidatus Aminicenantes bacterium]
MRAPAIKKMIIPLLFAGLLLSGLLATVGLGLHWYFTGRKPTQPIAYSHNLHLETVGLECDHCHQYADRSPRAGIPPADVCMECHDSTAVDKPGIKMLKSFWEKKEPVPWLKVHIQPGHVYFTHKRHIKAGVECAYCHGQVKAMTTARKVRSLEMGWCVTCHREKNAATDCLTCHK